MRRTIKELAWGKTPGLDGLPVEFYDGYAAALAPRLVTVYKEAREAAEMPLSTREALIISPKRQGTLRYGAISPIIHVDDGL